MNQPLSEVERARVAGTVAKVKELMPELAAEIKALRAAGFDVAWRDVEYIGPHRPDPPGTVSAAEMVLESTETVKKRMREHGSYR